jgi:hypothetical protein
MITTKADYIEKNIKDAEYEYVSKVKAANQLIENILQLNHLTENELSESNSKSYLEAEDKTQIYIENAMKYLEDTLTSLKETESTFSEYSLNQYHNAEDKVRSDIEAANKYLQDIIDLNSKKEDELLEANNKLYEDALDKAERDKNDAREALLNTLISFKDDMDGISRNIQNEFNVLLLTLEAQVDAAHYVETLNLDSEQARVTSIGDDANLPSLENLADAEAEVMKVIDSLKDKLK